MASRTSWDVEPDALALLDRLFPLHGHDSTPAQTRESRLYLVACAERAWDHLPGVCRAVVGISGRMAGRRRIRRAERDAARAAAEELFHGRGEPEAVGHAERLLRAGGIAVPAGPTADPDDWPGLAYLVYAPFTSMAPMYTWVPPALHCADLVRDVFGNPYRPAVVEPEWRTETVVAMATGMAASGDFFPMPVLADALDDAGCTDERILDHCRGPGPHARGCWVLEAILRRADPAAARPVLARISSFARPA